MHGDKSTRGVESRIRRRAFLLMQGVPGVLGTVWGGGSSSLSDPLCTAWELRRRIRGKVNGNGKNWHDITN